MNLLQSMLIRLRVFFPCMMPLLVHSMWVSGSRLVVRLVSCVWNVHLHTYHLAVRWWSEILPQLDRCWLCWMRWPHIFMNGWGAKGSGLTGAHWSAVSWGEELVERCRWAPQWKLRSSMELRFSMDVPEARTAWQLPPRTQVIATHNRAFSDICRHGRALFHN